MPYLCSDATWEKDKRYADLHRRYAKCDAKTCQCPNGRTFMKRPWTYVLCHYCGSSGMHTKCIERHETTYSCDDCYIIFNSTRMSSLYNVTQHTLFDENLSIATDVGAYIAFDENNIRNSEHENDLQDNTGMNAPREQCLNMSDVISLSDSCPISNSSEINDSEMSSDKEDTIEVIEISSTESSLSISDMIQNMDKNVEKQIAKRLLPPIKKKQTLKKPKKQKSEKTTANECTPFLFTYREIIRDFIPNENDRQSLERYRLHIFFKKLSDRNCLS